MPTKYYTFDTKEEAQAYNESVKAVSNFNGITTDWATPIKHPTLDKWAILVSPKVEIQSKQAEDLTEDWYAN